MYPPLPNPVMARGRGAAGIGRGRGRGRGRGQAQPAHKSFQPRGVISPGAKGRGRGRGYGPAGLRGGFNPRMYAQAPYMEDLGAEEMYMVEQQLNMEQHPMAVFNPVVPQALPVSQRIGRPEELFPKGVKARLQQNINKGIINATVGLEYLVEVQDAKAGPAVTPSYFCTLCDVFLSNKVPKVVQGITDNSAQAVRHMQSEAHLKKYFSRHFPTVYETLPHPGSEIKPDSRLARVIAYIEGREVEAVLSDKKVIASRLGGAHALMAKYIIKKTKSYCRVSVVIGHNICKKMKNEVIKVCKEAKHFQETPKDLAMWLKDKPEPPKETVQEIQKKNEDRKVGWKFRAFIKDHLKDEPFKDDCISPKNMEPFLNGKSTEEKSGAVGLEFLYEVYDDRSALDSGGAPGYYCSLCEEFRYVSSADKDTASLILIHASGKHKNSLHLQKYLELFFPSLMNIVNSPNFPVDAIDWSQVAPDLPEETLKRLLSQYAKAPAKAEEAKEANNEQAQGEVLENEEKDEPSAPEKPSEKSEGKTVEGTEALLDDDVLMLDDDPKLTSEEAKEVVQTQKAENKQEAETTEKVSDSNNKDESGQKNNAETFKRAQWMQILAKYIVNRFGSAPIGGVIIGRQAFGISKRELDKSAYLNNAKHFFEDGPVLRPFYGEEAKVALKPVFIERLGIYLTPPAKPAQDGTSQEKSEQEAADADDIREPAVFPEAQSPHLEKDGFLGNNVIGAEYFVEIQDLKAKNCPPPSYYCFLCNIGVACMPGLSYEDAIEAASSHVSSTFHQKLYLLKHFPSFKPHLQKSEYERTPVSNPILSRANDLLPLQGGIGQLSPSALLTQYINRKMPKNVKIGLVIGTATLEDERQNIRNKVENFEHVAETQDMCDIWLKNKSDKSGDSFKPVQEGTELADPTPDTTKAKGKKKKGKKSVEAPETATPPSSKTNKAKESGQASKTANTKVANNPLQQSAREAVHKMRQQFTKPSVKPTRQCPELVKHATELQSLVEKWLEKDPGRREQLSQKMSVSPEVFALLDKLDLRDAIFWFRLDGHQELLAEEEKALKLIDTLSAFQSKLKKRLEESMRKPLREKEMTNKMKTQVQTAISYYFGIDQCLKLDVLSKAIEYPVGFWHRKLNAFDRYDAAVLFKLPFADLLQKEVVAIMNQMQRPLLKFAVDSLKGVAPPKECKEDLSKVIREWFARDPKREQELKKHCTDKSKPNLPPLITRYDVVQQHKISGHEHLKSVVAWVLAKYPNLKSIDPPAAEHDLNKMELTRSCKKKLKLAITAWFNGDQPRRMKMYCEKMNKTESEGAVENKLDCYGHVLRLKLPGWQQLKKDVDQVLTPPPSTEVNSSSAFGPRKLPAKEPPSVGQRRPGSPFRSDFAQKRMRPSPFSSTWSSQGMSPGFDSGMGQRGFSSTFMSPPSSFMQPPMPRMSQPEPLFSPKISSLSPFMGQSSPFAPTQRECGPFQSSYGSSSFPSGSQFLTGPEKHVLRYMEEQKDLSVQMEKERDFYMNNPEKHRNYKQEWEKFYVGYCKKKGGQSFPAALLKPQWAEAWTTYIVRYYCRRINDELATLQKRYGVNRADIDSFKSNYPDLAEQLSVPISAKATASKFAEMEPDQNAVRDVQPRPSSHAAMAPIKVTVIDSLRLLSALDYHLEELSSHVKDRHEQAKTLESLAPGSSDDLLKTDGLLRLFNNVKTKLKSKMDQESDKSSTTWNLCSKALDHVGALLGKVKRPAAAAAAAASTAAASTTATSTSTSTSTSTNATSTKTNQPPAPSNRTSQAVTSSEDFRPNRAAQSDISSSSSRLLDQQGRFTRNGDRSDVFVSSGSRYNGSPNRPLYEEYRREDLQFGGSDRRDFQQRASEPQRSLNSFEAPRSVGRSSEFMDSQKRSPFNEPFKSFEPRSTGDFRANNYGSSSAGSDARDGRNERGSQFDRIVGSAPQRSSHYDDTLRQQRSCAFDDQTPRSNFGPRAPMKERAPDAFPNALEDLKKKLDTAEIRMRTTGFAEHRAEYEELQKQYSVMFNDRGVSQNFDRIPSSGTSFYGEVREPDMQPARMDFSSDTNRSSYFYSNPSPPRNAGQNERHKMAEKSWRF